ncbi:flagellar hook-length control protein FliK [Shewanella sp. Isolate11]|uniref:flagellar hook-length control protein FliK n=1 Tax=Shewanella sp. Isolate11 TaxID=2908530 RepID=UPI001EFD07C2|nr:flagellar hook-length control protein FliK [Shewanella sp. Isolate11]MCG9697147.1 flagellar hook-length control protein FliK [Shewanella sp. Isolate11]
MPQMNAVLLPSTEAASDKAKANAKALGTNSSIMSSERRSETASFSKALEQLSSANESVSTKRSASQSAASHAETNNPNASAVKAENQASPVSSAKESSTAQSAAEASATEANSENNDVSHVLAQINLAANLSGQHKLEQLDAQGVSASGENLPLDANLATLATEDTTLIPEDEAFDDEIADFDTADKIAADALMALPVDAEMVQANQLMLGQLSEAQRQQVEDVSGLDSEQLSQLPSKLLNRLVNEIDNLRGQQSSAANMPASLSRVIEQAQQLIAAKDAQLINSAPDNTSQRVANTGELASTALSEKQSGANSAMMAANVGPAEFKVDGKAILGEAKSEAGTKLSATEMNHSATSTKTQASERENTMAASDKAAAQSADIKHSDLKQAKLSVAMLSNAGLSNAELSSAESAEQLNRSESKLSSQPLGSLTLQRSETQAQYQLSIKSHADGALQMQQMIQKFSPVMRQQLLTMVSQGVQHAEIRLDPAELGHMMVRIQVQGDQTQVQFQVAQHQTRDLVEQAIPRLRELLADQGMQLTDSNVSQGGHGNQQSDGQGNGEQIHGSSINMDEISAEENLLSSNSATSYGSGIDYYA